MWTVGGIIRTEYIEDIDMYKGIVNTVHGVQTLYGNHFSYAVLVWRRIETGLKVNNRKYE